MAVERKINRDKTKNAEIRNIVCGKKINQCKKTSKEEYLNMFLINFDE